MPIRFDNDEGALQLLLVVERQHPREFAMHGVQCRGQDTKVDYAWPQALNKDERSEISVVR